MSVGFTNAVVEGLRFHGVEVSFEPGWERRGNGFSFKSGKPIGLITHHTGADYDSGLSILVNGRPDLQGPLCNCCTYSSGRIHIIAAHPANHAGASGGPSMGPLPRTSLFNPVVWGNEVMFPGVTPWTQEQYRSARILAGVVSGILLRPSAEWCRFHSETSLSGKWDPGAGRGPGIAFDGNRFRTEVWDALIEKPRLRKEDDLDYFEISGRGRMSIPCPTGSASKNNREVFLSASASSVNGPAWIQVFAQSAVSGVHDWKWTENDLTPSDQNLVRRPYMQVKSGTTHLVILWDLRSALEGAWLCLESIT